MTTGLILAALAAAVQGPAATQAGGEVRIEYVAHASFLIHSPGGAVVLIDPYADRVWLGYDFPKGLEADAVLVTHPHYDHDGGEFRGLSVPWDADQRVLRDPGEYRVGDIRVVGLRGKHADPYGKEFGQRNTVWVLEVGGLRIAHVGDNGPLAADVVRGMGRVDLLMMPADRDYHILSADETSDMIAAVRPRLVIPMHYAIPELEPGDGPSDLGPLEPWLEGREGVVRLDGNVLAVDAAHPLPEGEIVVFRRSPLVVRPKP